MPSSDRMIWKIWNTLCVLSVITFVLLAIVSITASFPGLGYPCYFAILVDYSSFKLHGYGAQMASLTSVFFLESYEMLVYVYSNIAIFLILISYIFVGMIEVYRAVKLDRYADVKKLIKLILSSRMVFVVISMLWCFQVFINLLSFKAVGLAAAFHALYFILFVLYIIFGTTRGVSPNVYNGTVALLKPTDKSIYDILIYFKGFVINFMNVAFVLTTLVQCLLIELVLGTHFRLKILDGIVIAMGLFFAMAIVLLIVNEFLFSRYIAPSLGIPVGVILACVLISVPTVRYNDKFSYKENGSEVHILPLVSGLLGTLGFLAAVMILVRLIRYCINIRDANSHVYKQYEKVKSSTTKKAKALGKRLRRKENNKPEDEYELPNYEFDESSSGEEGDEILYSLNSV